MKLIRPITIDSANLTSNVAVVGSEYSDVASYGLGDTVINTTGANPTFHEYESLAADNTGNALDDAGSWLDLGHINRYRMFDTVNGTATTNSASIDVTVAVDGRVDGLALFALDAEQVQVTVTAGAYGTVYDQTYSLLSDSGITSWYEYFSEDVVYNGDLVLIDLPLYTGPSVRVIITKASGTVSCGTMVLGQSTDIGASLYGAQGGITDYSRKETDEFGTYTLVERSYAKRTRFKMVVENNKADIVYQTLAEYRATPAVWYGTDDYALSWLFGWARDWNVELALTDHSYVSLELEGLT